MNLRSTIDQLAKTFAEGVLSALREASLEDLLASKGGPPTTSANSATPKATRPRQAAAERKPLNMGAAAPAREKGAGPKEHAGDVLAELVKHPGGMRSEQLQKALNLTKLQLVPVLTWALSEGRITKTGEKRGTTYKAK